MSSITAPQDAALTSGRPMAQADLRAANMGLLLRHLHRTGGRTRAQLATETGLSKATTSSLITDLTERGLVREGEVLRGGMGRPGQNLTLDGGAVSGIGVELSVDFVAITALTLAGTVIRESILPLDVAHLGLDFALDQVAAAVQRTVDSLEESGVMVAGITLAPPGVIDYDTGTLRFAPNLGWRGVPLVAGITQRLSPKAPAVRLENDAKLAALAEYDRLQPEGINDLLYLSGEVGVGAGIIADGRLLRGHSGFSGEVGHLPLDPTMSPCKCGRRGCWELVVGLGAFLALACDEDDELRDPARALGDRLLALAARADAGDRRTLDAVATITDRLAAGLGILVDVLNPGMIVLGGYYAYFGGHILPHLAQALAARRMDEGSAVRLVTSEPGFMATARGGALLVLEDVFRDPTLVPARG